MLLECKLRLPEQAPTVGALRLQGQIFAPGKICIPHSLWVMQEVNAGVIAGRSPHSGHAIVAINSTAILAINRI
jgi:hypothetical protein